MRIIDIINAVETFCPLVLQESYDNAGLQISSDTNAEVCGVLLCLDVTENVVREAVEKHCNLILAHHPLLFSPKKRITTDDYVGRTIIEAVKHDITIYAAHTNLDNAKGGVNYKMAEKMGLENLHFLSPSQNGNSGSGLVGELKTPMAREEFLAMLKTTFKAEGVRYNDARKDEIRSVAICGGAGAFLAGDAVREHADAFVTGEIGYHRFFGMENDILLVELGHYETEQYTVEILRDLVRSVDEKVVICYTETNPVRYQINSK